VIDTVVEIDRMPLTFVTTASERAELVWRRARDALGKEIPAALESAIAYAVRDDDSYVFIDRLDVTCAIRSDWAPAMAGSVFAHQLARSLREGLDGETTIVFRDRAEYLSAFLGSLPDGAAHSRWWFGAFDGLRHLPRSIAVRTLVVAEGPLGWQALAGLTPELLRRLTSSLEPVDIEHMLRALQPGPVSKPADTIMNVLDRADADGLRSRLHQAFEAVVELGRAAGEPASRGDALAVSAILAIDEAARLGRLGPARSTPTSTVAAWCRDADVDTAGLTSLLELDASLVLDRVGAAPAATRGDAPDARESHVEFTPFGGALPLAVVLARTGAWDGWRSSIRQTIPEGDLDALAGSVALRVVARSLSPRHPALIERDAVVWRVFGGRSVLPDRQRAAAAVRAAGDDRTPTGVRTSAWLHARARELLEAFSRSVPGCDGATAAYLRSQLLSMPAAVNIEGTAGRLGPAPLDILLAMSGLNRAEVTLPDGRRLVVSRDLDP
jgi:hypothetical protein